NQTSLDFIDRVTCIPNGPVIVHLSVNAIQPDGSLRAVHRVTVKVHDMDDNWPKFDQVRWNKRLKEVLYRKGRRLDLPKARDADILDEHSRIHYRLESSESKTMESVPDAYEGPFKLEVTATGQPGLILTEDLDAEVTARHQMVLAAVSPSVVFAQPIETSNRQYPKGVHNSIQSPTTARLLIDVEVADMNDNEPRFKSPLYNVSVTEDTPPDTVIYE
ncbi:hypothetical protein PHET_11651, partial [Paragonimus heterotremus]